MSFMVGSSRFYVEVMVAHSATAAFINLIQDLL